MITDQVYLTTPAHSRAWGGPSFMLETLTDRLSRVAVELREDHAGERQRVAERARRVHRVLPLHRVDDEQRLDGAHRRGQRGDLAHHRLVDGQPSGRVDDQHVVIVPARPVQRRRRDRDRLLGRRRGEEVDADLLRERRELLDRRRAIDVGRHEQHLLFLRRDEPGELCSRRRLAGALQAGQQDDRRRLRSEIERLGGTAHQRRQFACNDADQRLSRRQRSDDLRADRFLAQVADERLDDRQCDVGLEQREPHFPQRVLDVGFGEPRFAAQRLDDARQAFGQGVEHGVSIRGARSGSCGTLR
jgi:hypothetical protein